MTRRALLFFAAALALLATALSTGIAVYYLFFGMMAAMLLLALATSLVTLFTLRVRNRCETARVARGESVTLRLTARRATFLPVGDVTLRVTGVGGEETRLRVALPPLRAKEYRYSLPCPHRGAYRMGVTAAEVADAFGLFCFHKAFRGSLCPVDVCPRALEAEPLALAPGDADALFHVRMTEDNASPADVRAWRDGDMLKKVHWKLSARRRELMVRTYEETARPDTLILLDVYPLDAAPEQALETQDALCEQALAVARAQLESGFPVRMPLTCARPFEASGQNAADVAAFEDALTKLRFDGPYPFEQLLALETRRMQRTGGVVLVTSRLTATVADYAMSMRRVGAQVLAIWVTENARADTMGLMMRMELGGVLTRKVNPWPEAEYSA